mmetsp:Transcript_32296/g.49447  ORF Transcript_32296/g.49447 Transcript_32296/m.49447 type:complete len:99 (+) Transcript_32296:109-405(+)
MTVVGFFGLRKKLNLQMYHIIGAMMIPVTLDYAKREYFVRQSKEQDRKDLADRRKVVNSIMAEKKNLVSFEQVMRFVFKLNLDKKIEGQRKMLPMTFM